VSALVLNLAAAIIVVAAVGILPRGASRDADLFFLIGALAVALFVAAWAKTPRARHRRARS
jgi:hypothetical protein